MASPTVPWGIPLFDDNTPFAPIQAPFNAQSAALNDALSAGAFAPYATKALMDAAPGTRVGQHASVYADGTVANNGDYRWSGTAWSIPSALRISSLGGVGTPGLPIIEAGVWTGAQFNGGTSPQVFQAAFPTKCASIQLTMGKAPHTSVSVFDSNLTKTGVTLAVPGSYTGASDIHYLAVGW